MKPLLRRLLAWVVVVLAVHACAFLLLRTARGGPFDAERELPPEIERALRAEYHLDEPLPRQYLRSLGGLLHGDFGPSMRYRGVAVRDLLLQGLPVSLAVGLGALVLALALGLPAGTLAARRRGRFDAAVLAASTLALALPGFVLAGAFVALFSFRLGWLPPAGLGGPRHLLLPALSLGLPCAAQVARLARSSVLEVLASPAVRAARAAGLPEGRILRRHVLRRALGPVIAFLGPAAAGLLTGSLVIEQVFALPGLGAHFVQAALNRDYTLALGATVLYTALLGLLSLAADLARRALDPRLEAVG
ncbi:MAG: ABC transporter permease subunit [Planctomycetota bacterium]|nr:MAG: ABC transporter permease subunit [Planctomycetota bacterium]